MKTNAELNINELAYDNISYIKDKTALIKTGITIDRKTSTIGFEKAEIKIADLILSVNGTVQNAEETFTDIKIISKDSKLNNVLSVLPSTWIPEKVLAYKYTGNVNFDVTVKGISSKKISPLVEVNFNSSGNSIIPDKENYSLKNISLIGFYSSRKSESNPVSCLSFKNISATLEGKPVKGNVVLENLSNPYVDISIDAEVSLAAISRYFAFDIMEQPQGIIALHGFIKGRAAGSLNSKAKKPVGSFVRQSLSVQSLRSTANVPVVTRLPCAFNAAANVAASAVGVVTEGVASAKAVQLNRAKSGLAVTKNRNSPIFVSFTTPF